MGVGGTGGLLSLLVMKGQSNCLVFLFPMYLDKQFVSEISLINRAADARPASNLLSNLSYAFVIWMTNVFVKVSNSWDFEWGLKKQKRGVSMCLYPQVFCECVSVYICISRIQIAVEFVSEEDWRKYLHKFRCPFRHRTSIRWLTCVYNLLSFACKAFRASNTVVC